MTAQRRSSRPLPETHYAAILVHIRDERREAVGRAVAELRGVEIPREDDGGMVVVLRAPDRSALAERARIVELIPGVVSSRLIDQWTEDEDSCAA